MFSRGMSFKLRFKGRINQANRIMCSTSSCKWGKRKLSLRAERLTWTKTWQLEKASAESEV